jgi:hypothetical protein
VTVDVVDRRFGPVRLAPGYSAMNATTYVFAAFITIGMLAFISFIQPYLLNANLQVPDGQRVSAVVPGDAKALLHSTLTLAVDPQVVHVFDSETGRSLRP